MSVKTKHKALLNNCVDNDEVILHQREMDKDMDNDTMICGLCGNYDFVMYFCDKHPEYGELTERDTCDDYKECD